jgi:hypothetical protein
MSTQRLNRHHERLGGYEFVRVPNDSHPRCFCKYCQIAGGRSGCLLLLQAANEEFAFVDKFFWKMIVQVEEKLLVPNNFPAPGAAVQALELPRISPLESPVHPS